MTFGSSASSRPGAGVRVAALVEHVAAVADLQAATRVLLDHDHGDAGPVDLAGADEGLVLAHRRQPGGRLVEQQHARAPSSARAPSRRDCRSPPERPPARWRAALAEHREQVVHRLEPLRRACFGRRNRPICRFSSMVSEGKTLFVCGTKPTPACTSLLALWLVMSSPFERAPCPERTGTRPNSAFSSVDLPAPFGPMMPTSSPGYAVQVAAVQDVDARQVARDRGAARRRAGSPVPGVGDHQFSSSSVAAHRVGVRPRPPPAPCSSSASSCGDRLVEVLVEHRVVAEVLVVVRAEVGVDRRPGSA